MYIYPAIDLYGGKAVRLFQGDYARMTVSRENPCDAAREFAAAGASHIHLVDLEGAKTGKPENLAVIEKIVKSTGLFAQVGGGIRNMETVRRYLARDKKREGDAVHAVLLRAIGDAYVEDVLLSALGEEMP